LFFSYERPEIADFRAAINQFKHDLPAVLKALRQRIDAAYSENAAFTTAAAEFLKQARESINPAVADTDIREMLIQHILTEDIFSRVFGNDEFHRENNVAQALYNLERLFFRGDVKQRTLSALEPYYAAIRSTAALIQSHSEKQGFLKAVYENFYKIYNPKAADRLGVVYTPNEIVRFIVRSADQLCEQHFGRNLIDRNVEILDPATGTGTFIVELLEHFRGQPAKLKYKFLNELHANEVAILPYYVANLNIEAIYAAIMEEYAEFPNVCFMDTLDNTDALTASAGQHYGDLLGGISTENVERIRRQNNRKISVVIGNPPYNANQKNESDDNKNRTYPEIDSRIKSTYVKESTAQKTKAYDMYARFFRWASDRIDGDGIIAFVTSRGFIDKRNFDGFRKLIAKDFSDVYVVDLGGDVHDNSKLSGTMHNVFGIQIGVAISFLVERKNGAGNRIHYGRRPEFETAEEKLAYLHTAELKHAAPELIRPDAQQHWVRLTNNDFGTFIPLVSKDTKGTKQTGQERAIFKMFSLGVVTNRDDSVYGHTSEDVSSKVRHLIDVYDQALAEAKIISKTEDAEDAPEAPKIKWTRLTKSLLESGTKLTFYPDLVVPCMYRPFSSQQLYFSKQLNEMQYRLASLYGATGRLQVPTIVWSDPTSQKPFMCLAVNGLFDLHLVGAASGAVGAPRSIVTPDGRQDNITDWALEQFIAHYGDSAKITKDDIFNYVYAVLNDPAYREEYATNLKRNFPRIPMYGEFSKWRDAGQTLLNLHTGYGTIEPFPLDGTDIPDDKVRATGQSPRTVLKNDPASGVIVLDDETRLSGVPPKAWDYILGGRSAINWILDQHKERNPKDPVVKALFNIYRFSDHKTEAIDLLCRVVAVSTGTMAVIDAMHDYAR
jgi:predicted helicase